MLVADVLRYWYGVEIPQVPRRLHAFIMVMADYFSMPILIRTLFAPWRRDVISTTGLALPERLRVIVYNLVAVLVGFFVRLFVLLVASFLIALSLALGTILLAVWVVMPVLPIVLFFAGVVMLFR